jgi:hypothetical protein
VWAVAGALPLVAFTALVTLALFDRPDLFLANRYHSIVFDELFEKGLPFNLALYAPWDPIDLAGIDMVGEAWGPAVLALVIALTTALALLVSRRPWVRAAGLAVSIGLTGFVSYSSRLDLIGPDEAVLHVVSDLGRQQVDVTFRQPTMVRGFRVGRLLDIPLWNTPDRPKSFAYEVVDETGSIAARGRASGRQINLLSIDRPVTRIVLHGIPATADWPAQDTRFFR